MITWHSSHFTTDPGALVCPAVDLSFLSCLGLDSSVAQLPRPISPFSDKIPSILRPISLSIPSSLLRPLFLHPYPTHQMSLLLILPSPSPDLSVSLSFFLPSMALLWRSGMIQSRGACPCLITLIKHPVRWNDLAPTPPPNALCVPHHPSLPVVLQLYVRQGSKQAQSSLHKAAIRFSLSGTCSATKLQRFPHVLASLEVWSESPFLPDLVQGKTEMKAVPWMVKKKHFRLSLLLLCLMVKKKGYTCSFSPPQIRSACFFALVGFPLSLHHKAEIVRGELL